MAELKLFSIVDTPEYDTMKNEIEDADLLLDASTNTYNIACKKLKSNIDVKSYPSVIDYLCTVLDENEQPVIVSFKSAYDIVKAGKTVKCKIIHYNSYLKDMKSLSYLYKLFTFDKDKSIDENIARKLMFICKASNFVKNICVDKIGITCDYPRMLVTEFMNEYTYELYQRYSIDTTRVCRFLMTQEVYANLEIALEIICTGEAIRIGKESFELYHKLPKYNFINSFLRKGMRVSEIMRLFEKATKRQVHKLKLTEFIEGKDVMVDYKNPEVPIFTVAILN